MRKESIVDINGNIYAFELLLGKPKNGKEDIEKVLKAIDHIEDTNTLYHINIYPKTLIEYKDVIASKIKNKNKEYKYLKSLGITLFQGKLFQS